jgi:hypothetical protein
LLPAASAPDRKASRHSIRRDCPSQWKETIPAPALEMRDRPAKALTVTVAQLVKQRERVKRQKNGKYPVRPNA